MERFRELVSKLGVVNVSDSSRSSSPYPASNISTRDVVVDLLKVSCEYEQYSLEQLPVTKDFVESIPYEDVKAKAAENDKKALQATQLMRRVNDLVQCHVSEARELKSYMAQISKYQSELAQTTKHAESIFTQLRDLDKELSLLDETSLCIELDQLEQAEDASFERARVDKKKQEYLTQLASFEKDRLDVIAKSDDGTARLLLQNKQRNHSYKRSNSSSTSSMISRKAIDPEIKLESLMNESDLDNFLGATIDNGDRVKIMEGVVTKKEQEIRGHGSIGTDESLKEAKGKDKKSIAKKTKPEDLAKQRVMKEVQSVGKAKPPSRRLDIMGDEDFDE